MTDSDDIDIICDTAVKRGKYIPDPDEMGDDPDWGTYQ